MRFFSTPPVHCPPVQPGLAVFFFSLVSPTRPAHAFAPVLSGSSGERLSGDESRAAARMRTQRTYPPERSKNTEFRRAAASGRWFREDHNNIYTVCGVLITRRRSIPGAEAGVPCARCIHVNIVMEFRTRRVFSITSLPLPSPCNTCAGRPVRNATRTCASTVNRLYKRVVPAMAAGREDGRRLRVRDTSVSMAGERASGGREGGRAASGGNPPGFHPKTRRTGKNLTFLNFVDFGLPAAKRAPNRGPIVSATRIFECTREGGGSRESADTGPFSRNIGILGGVQPVVRGKLTSGT